MKKFYTLIILLSTCAFSSYMSQGPYQMNGMDQGPYQDTSVTSTCDSNLIFKDTTKTWSNAIALSCSLYCDSGKIIIQHTSDTLGSISKDSVLNKKSPYLFTDTISGLTYSTYYYFRFIFNSDAEPTMKDTTRWVKFGTADSSDTSNWWGTKPFISYSPDTISIATGQNISTTMSNTGGPVDSFTISPALPSGISLNNATGAITGSSVNTNPQTDYSIIAWSSLWGNDTATINVTITTTLVKAEIKYTPNMVKDTVSKSHSHQVTVVSGSVDSFTVLSILPAGMSINKTTGAITGTPTAPLRSDNYRIKAWSSGGHDTASINITVIPYTSNPDATSTTHILLIGDSVSKQGIAYPLRGVCSGNYYDWNIIFNYGLNDQGTAEQISGWSASYAPYLNQYGDNYNKWVRYNAGIHDMGHVTDTTQYLINLVTILGAIHDSGYSLILATTTPQDSTVWPSYPNSKTLSYNRNLVKAADSVYGSGYYVLDDKYTYRGTDSAFTPWIDGQHFSAPGYARMAEHTFKVMSAGIGHSITRPPSASYSGSGFTKNEKRSSDDTVSSSWSASGLTPADSTPFITVLKHPMGRIAYVDTMLGIGFNPDSGFIRINSIAVNISKHKPDTIIFTVPSTNRGTYPLIYTATTDNYNDSISFRVLVPGKGTTRP